MKPSNTLVSILVIAAVLVFAYALGLLIRRARTGSGTTPQPSSRKELPADLRPSYGPRTAQTEDTPEARAQRKDRKAAALEKMEAAPEQEKEKFRRQVTEQVSGRRGGKGRPNPAAGPWQQRKTKTQRPSGTARPQEEVGTPVPSSENTKQDTDQAEAVPSAAGPD